MSQARCLNWQWINLLQKKNLIAYKSQQPWDIQLQTWRASCAKEGDDFRHLAGIQQSLQISEEKELFPVVKSTTHRKAMLADNTPESKHLPLTSLSYFPQELAFSSKTTFLFG